MAIREISDDDLDAVRGLLIEGFPFRSTNYWTKGLANLGSLPRVEGFPRYGYLVDADSAPQGLLLTITSDHRVHGVRTSISSWYVREQYRRFSLPLFRRALELEKTTFINPSPSEQVKPILKAFGFKPYTGGMMMLDLRTTVRSGSHHAAVRRFDSRHIAELPEPEQRIAGDHLRMGCDVFGFETGGPPGLLIHRRKWVKGALPCSQVIFADPHLMIDLAGPAMRAFARRGSVLAFGDVACEAQPTIGRVVGRGVRYFKGAHAPPVGDLAYSELAVFGP